MRLSHSAVDLYNLCSEKYRLHYIEKYRGTTLGSPLFFGGYYGETVQAMAEKKINLEEAYAMFDTLMSKVDINGEIYDLPECEHVRYFKSDYDEEIMTKEDDNRLKEFLERCPVEETFFDVLYTKQREGTLTVQEQKCLNLQGWMSLRRKGHLLIKSYHDKILPRIKKVYDIEKEVKMTTDDDQHGFIGFIDMICDFEMDDGSVEKVLFDNKTSSKPYPRDCIEKKQQLAFYEYVEEIGLVGFIVGIKTLKKPRRGALKGQIYADQQVVVGNISKKVQEKYIDILDETMHNIEDGKFEKNADGCVAFGQKCQFWEICWRNDYSKVVKKDD